MERSKYGVWGIWIGGAAAILLGNGWVSTAGHVVVWLTLAVHLIEFGLLRPTLERAGGSIGHHFVQTLLYGLFHWLPIKKRLDAASSAIVE